MSERFIASLDLGTSKMILSVAKVCGENIEPIFSRRFPSDGLQYGKVVNPKRAADSIRKAVSEAESELDIKLGSVCVTLPRFDVRQVLSTGEHNRPSPEQYIIEEDLHFLRDVAINSYGSLNKESEEIYEAVAQSYTTEDLFQASEDMITGSTGAKIEGNFKLFIGKKNASDNIERAATEAGLSVFGKYFAPLVSAKCVLSSAEMDNGVALMEIGAGVSSVAIFTDGILRHYGAIPFGGRNVTIDIKNECDLTEALAENIKLAYGACLPEKLQNMSEKILVISNEEDGSSRKVPVKRISEIADCRMREIFEALLYITQDSGLMGKMRSGIVLIGGGASLTNAANLLREMSGMNVRIGYPKPKGISLNDHPVLQNTDSSESIGLILESATIKGLDSSREKEVDTTPGDGSLFGKLNEKKPRPRKQVLGNVGRKVENDLGNTIGSLWDTFVNPENNK